MTTVSLGNEHDEMPALALGLRQLILSGEHFQRALCRQLAIGPTDLSALRHLCSDGPLPPRELAARLEITSGTVTPLLDRLEKPGFLTRNDNPEDRRSLLINITPAGQEAMRWVDEQFGAALNQALHDVPDLAPDHLADILTIFADALDARAALPTPDYVPTLHAVDEP